MNSRDEILSSTIPNSVRRVPSNLLRQQRSQLTQTTRENFRPSSQSLGSPSGRSKKKPTSKKYTLFLSQKSNADYYPSVTECIYLQENGFGKKTVEFKLNWSMTRIKRCICEMYPRVQLESVGFRFGKNTQDKKIIKLTVNTIEELMKEVPRGMIIIIPNRDLPCPDHTTANNANVDESYKNSLTDLGHNRHKRSATTRRPLIIRRSDSRSQPSNDESDEDVSNQSIQNQDRIVNRQASQINENSNEFTIYEIWTITDI
ncbi:uncharacterized protein LOC105834589 [Monomorium pharaonis]|uniref:uncharacterized protein LOC105834589 n=1 Tax=Monomorium pharaonis TaxID=307658 RepID=UPI001747CEA4|nr:uncharacterized protein LOC105834589 [Monomorium pharaonis]XP_036147806.1 uncharacterized protein LOC105834589 [Monomorium pharaonis]